MFKSDLDFFQENAKHVHLFVYSGPPPNARLRGELNMKSFECFKDPSTSYMNAVMITNTRHRPGAMKELIEKINSSRGSEDEKFVLRKQSQFEDEIMALDRSDGIRSLKQHGFYQRIQDAKNRGDSTYYKWPNTDEECIERNNIKELHIDMVKPSGKTRRKSGEKPETKTATYSFDSDDDEGAAGAAGGVEASPGIPVRPRSQLGLRKKRMAYRLNEDDEDDAGAAAGAGSGSAQALPAAVAEPVPAPVPPVAQPAPGPAPRPADPAQLPLAVAVEYIPRNADNAAMYMEVDRMDARIQALEKKLADLEETNGVLTSNEAVYQIAYNTIEARLKEKDEMHAELVKAKDEKHTELMKAQAEISKIKEEKYLDIIKGNTDCFMRLMAEKDEKYAHMYEMVDHLQNAYKRPRSSS